MEVCTYVRDSDGKQALVREWCQYWLVNGNTLKDSCAAHALIGIPTILKHRIPGISDEGNIGKAALPALEIIGNDWKADDEPMMAFDGDRRTTYEFQ